MHYSHERGPNQYDIKWRPRIQLAIELLQEMQSQWLADQFDFNVPSVAGILFRVFGLDLHSHVDTLPEFRKLTIGDWIGSIKSVQCECEQFLPICTELEICFVIEGTQNILASAVESWSDNPFCPLCESLAMQVLTFLNEKGCVTFVR